MRFRDFQRQVAALLTPGEDGRPLERYDTVDARGLNPLIAAYVGDAYYHLFVRRRLLAYEQSKVRALDWFSAQIVSAARQAQAYAAIEPRLSEEERAIFRRGRNAKSHAPRAASVQEYHASTGFEALLGTLYLTGDLRRLERIVAEQQLRILRDGPGDGGKAGGGWHNAKGRGDVMIEVTLLEHTPEPERVVAMAARLCYSPAGAAELKEKLPEKRVAEMVEMLVNLGHASTLEHVSFTFGIEGVSRVLTHQLVRHRLASYSQQSQRYVAAHDFAYVTPPSIAAVPEAMERFDALMRSIRETYDAFTALGIPKEDARYALANAAETKIVVTMNARSLLHFFNLRCCNRAQWEIRALACKMLAEAKKAAPLLFRNAGASCVQFGRCPEGKMTCGKFDEKIKQREP